MRVLFVCTGNICRSPTAEAIFRGRTAALGIQAVTDSAGISAEETGNPPHPVSTAVAERRGYPMPRRVARRVTPEDFEDFDLLVCMDRRHVATLRRMAPPGRADRACLLMEFVDDAGDPDVPDPWYGPDEGYDTVFDMIDRGVEALIVHLSAGRG